MSRKETQGVEAKFDIEKMQEMLKGANIKTLRDITGKDGLIQTLLKSTIESMMKAELEEHLGYAHGDVRSKDTENSRNGYSEKTLKTSSGTIDIEVPRDRQSSYEPKIVPKYETIDSEFEEKIISMYARGMTTRDISAHLKELYGAELSPTLISKVTDKISHCVTEWRSRALDPVYPVVFLDAIHYKVQSDGRVISKAVYVCLGITIQGKKEILGFYVGENESSSFWLSVLTDLQNRGVQDILIACIDGLKGFPEAIKSIFPKTEVQLCVVHQIRNSLKYVSTRHQKEFLIDLKTVYQAPNQEIAFENLGSIEKKWNKTYPLVINSWIRNFENLSQYFKYAEPIRKLIYTTNIIEGYNRQLRKVTKNRSVFPNDESLLKLMYLATKDVEKKWKQPKWNWAQTISQLVACRILFNNA
jgi:putative transposase